RHHHRRPHQRGRGGPRQVRRLGRVHRPLVDAGLLPDRALGWWADGEEGGQAGWIFELGALDLAGGTRVHINAGAAGRPLVLLLHRALVWWSDGEEGGKAGWIFELGALDFAGGTVVHINAGVAALALVLVLGRRTGWPKEPMRPHNLPFVLLGAGLLWFGWFG